MELGHLFTRSGRTYLEVLQLFSFVPSAFWCVFFIIMGNLLMTVAARSKA